MKNVEPGTSGYWLNCGNYQINKLQFKFRWTRLTSKGVRVNLESFGKLADTFFSSHYCYQHRAEVMIVIHRRGHVGVFCQLCFAAAAGFFLRSSSVLTDSCLTHGCANVHTDKSHWLSSSLTAWLKKDKKGRQHTHTRTDTHSCFFLLDKQLDGCLGWSGD